MNLSKLTNPVEPENNELEKSISSNHNISSILNQNIQHTENNINSNNNDNYNDYNEIDNNRSTQDNQEDEYVEDVVDDNNDNDDDDDDDNNSDYAIDENDENGFTPKSEQKEKFIKERSTAEYRTLYNYLLEKYKNSMHISKVLDEFELYLKKLAKYQQLRNNMLIDTLKYLDNHESFQSIDNLSHSEIQSKLKSIIKKDNKVSPLLSKLLQLEKIESDEDSRTNLNNFHNLIGINDSLSSDLATQENNIFPDLYTKKYDFFELVKKNQCFKNDISTMLDLQNLIEKESYVDPQNVTQVGTRTTRKRNKTSSVVNGLVTHTKGPGESLKITIQRKKRKLNDEDSHTILV